MASLRIRLVTAVAVFLLPVAPVACTADQFVGGDGGSDAATNDVGADRSASDGGAPLDAPTTNDAKSDVVQLDGCVSDASANFSCGNGGHCLTTAQYCEELPVSPICVAMPVACLCDHSCTCLKTNAANFCGDGGMTCNNNGSELTLGCQ